MENPPSSRLSTSFASRVIDGTLYVREPAPYAHKLKVHDLGHGQLEASLMPEYSWRSVSALGDAALSDVAASQGNIWVDGAWKPYTPSDAELLDKAAKNAARSSRRAKTQVRRLCKAKQLTTMLTLTYRENMQDRSRMARDFDVFIKRVRRVVPDFQYVCVFERQKRGAWHAHIAVPKVLSHYLHKGVLVRSYDLLRSIWRAVVTEGNVDVSRRKRLGRSIAKLASYLSKYITKGFESGEGSGDSYRASGRALPRPMVFHIQATTLGAACTEVVELLGSEITHCRHFHHALLDCGGYFIALSP